MSEILIPDNIRLANTNQQTTYNPNIVPPNINASYGRGTPFDPSGGHADPSKIVVLIGSGETEDLTQLDAVAERHEGMDRLHIIVVGAAVNRLKPTEEFPLLKQADAIFFNSADPDTDNLRQYYRNNAVILREYAPDIPVYLSATNGPAAYDAFLGIDTFSDESLGEPLNVIQINGSNPHYTYADEEFVVGLGSISPTAGLITAMMQGYRQFELIGLGAAKIKQTPEGQTSSDVRQTFLQAAGRDEQPNRFPEHDMLPELRGIKPDNKLLISVGENLWAEMPSGQWYGLQELGTLVAWGRTQGMEFTFHGDRNFLSYRHLMMGQNIRLIHDLRPPEHRMPTGTTLEGLASRDNGQSTTPSDLIVR